ncbi:uncharacterized protein A1O5_01421 [Cladophialophora psammophila CBS 110553]|uniref:GDP/GTP exchange factor Sec2 N-terminal domain-containing protein n=1 Tax=Cladophialophora psammophila CBS 110553 TaxID=1182543 RepID=W9XCQ8_9EURO|nr:uncharacterized protein A1O5_01421 [Cladophialophora psammophila CBS 110553]EXJ74726.1 hypothetical protein A1O5_01421 [Cladophialophora psammophila CBS 110553]
MATSILLNSTPMDLSSTNSTASYHSSPDPTCPHCGYHLPPPSKSSAEAVEANRRIRDLEAQVRLLNSKATAAADKLADYEDELAYLRDAHSNSLQQQQQAGSNPRLSSPPVEGIGSLIAPLTPGQTLPQQQSRLASISAFLPGRRREANTSVGGQIPLTPATGTFPQSNSAGYANNTLSPPKTPFFGVGAIPNNSTPTLSSTLDNIQSAVSLSSLQSSLEEERTLRLRAESSLSQTQTELEELTAQLFGQANEMVANERKARAKLEERVKVLEQRDVEKRKRLERLERAVSRIERVRGMVGD